MVNIVINKNVLDDMIKTFAVFKKKKKTLDNSFAIKTSDFSAEELKDFRENFKTF